ncbi:hypothetical protein [Pengzhenrongella phosphoraccumulans]
MSRLFLQDLKDAHAPPADESYVRALVHRRYLDVEPWPFQALLPENHI